MKYKLQGQKNSAFKEFESIDKFITNLLLSDITKKRTGVARVETGYLATVEDEFGKTYDVNIERLPNTN